MAQCYSQAIEEAGQVPLRNLASKLLEKHQDVKDYYCKHLKSSKDLKTNVCALSDNLLPKIIRDALKDVHKEVLSRYYGSGESIPECLESCRILDLGSGSGRDCYIASKLVGEKGHVTGIDMADEQIQVAKKYICYHTQKFGYQKPNVDFIQGYIENLGEAGLEEKTFDIVISNCVGCLTPDERAVLEEAYRVLKNGGEMYFSDIYANSELPEAFAENKVLWGEGLAGAICWKDLFRFAKEVGFSTPRLVTARSITVDNVLEDLIGGFKYAAATFRLFKVPKDELRHGGWAMYSGGIPGYEQELRFDANFTFKKGEAVHVDDEMAAILRSSRFSKEFLIQPEREDTRSTPGEKVKEIIIDPFQLAEQHMSSSCPDLAEFDNLFCN